MEHSRRTDEKNRGAFLPHRQPQWCRVDRSLKVRPPAGEKLEVWAADRGTTGPVSVGSPTEPAGPRPEARADCVCVGYKTSE